MTDDMPRNLFDADTRRMLFARRVLVLDGVLDDDNGVLLMTQLLALAAEDPHADITLWIHSPGGSVPAMLAIRDLMRTVPCDVATVAFGLACSAGQFLLSAGTQGKRYALPHARILMHQPSAGIGGTASDIAIQAEQFKLTKVEMAQLISEHTGQPVEQIQADSERDRWFTAQQALEYGFVDHVVSRVAQVPNGSGPAPA